MQIYRTAPGQLVFEGQNITRAMVLGSARQYVVDDCRMNPLDADDLLIDMPNRVTRAWWRDDVGFIQEDDTNAVAVTVVNISNDERVFGAKTPATRNRHDHKMQIM